MTLAMKQAGQPLPPIASPDDVAEAVEYGVREAGIQDVQLTGGSEVDSACGEVPLVVDILWSEAFGQRHLGRIQGVAQTLTVLSSGLGPVVFAKSMERYHSYSPLLLALAGAVVVVAIAARTVRLPDRQSTHPNGLVST